MASEMNNNTENLKDIFLKMILSVFILCCSIFFAYIVQLLYVEISNEKYRDNTKSLYSEFVVGTKGLNLNENMYTTVDRDPQIDIRFPHELIEEVVIIFSKKLDRDVNIAIYYANDESYSQEKCISNVFEEGTTRAIIAIPKGIYNRLRVDIGNERNIGVTFTLSDIAIKQSTTGICWWVFGCFFCVFGCLGVNYYISLEQILKENMSNRAVSAFFIVVFFLLLAFFIKGISESAIVFAALVIGIGIDIAFLKECRKKEKKDV